MLTLVALLLATAQPVVESNASCLLGGADGKKWLTDEAMAKRLKGGERYRIVRGSASTGEAQGLAPRHNEDLCQGTLEVPFDPQPDQSAPWIAVGGSWDLSPRKAEDLSAARAKYGKLLQPFLASKGIKAAAEVRQLYRVDLDGDGKDEVVAAVQNFSGESDSQPRPYSGVLVRLVVAGKVTTVALELAKGPDDEGVSEFSVPFFLDLNGDGTMEVVVYGHYPKGFFTMVYALEGGKFKKVLNCACGD
jgi:hypothetical protein